MKEGAYSRGRFLSWHGNRKRKLKEQMIAHIKELYTHMEIEITGSDLTEKNLFSCTDPAVIEA